MVCPLFVLTVPANAPGELDFFRNLCNLDGGGGHSLRGETNPNRKGPAASFIQVYIPRGQIGPGAFTEVFVFDSGGTTGCGSQCRLLAAARLNTAFFACCFTTRTPASGLTLFTVRVNSTFQAPSASSIISCATIRRVKSAISIRAFTISCLTSPCRSGIPARRSTSSVVTALRQQTIVPQASPKIAFTFKGKPLTCACPADGLVCGPGSSLTLSVVQLRAATPSERSVTTS
jgi:hypothetical protein